MSKKKKFIPCSNNIDGLEKFNVCHDHLLQGRIPDIDERTKFHLSTEGYYFIYRFDKNNDTIIRATLYCTLPRMIGPDDKTDPDGNLQVDDVRVADGEENTKTMTQTDVINYFESRIFLKLIR